MWEYRNGNVLVKIEEDGTKSFEFEGQPEFDFPTQLDIKLTNRCSNVCGFCHEEHGIIGSHADLETLKKDLQELPDGIELALGGGDLLTLGKDLENFLLWCTTERNFIPSITLHYNTVRDNVDYVKELISRKLIYGLGISIPQNIPSEHKNALLGFKSFPNIVLHFIAGIHSVSLMEQWIDLGFTKLLILGFKKTPFSMGYYNSKKETIDQNTLDLKRHMYKLFFRSLVVLDNLALEDLDVRRFFTEDGFNKVYMGNESSHSIYLDAVNRIYLPSSYADKTLGVSANEISLINYYKQIKTKF